MSVTFIVLQISLREGCRKILVADCYQLLQKLVRIQKKGVYVDGKSKNFLQIYFSWRFLLFLFNFYTLEKYTHNSCHFSVDDDYIIVNCTVLQHICGLVLNIVIQA